MNIFKQLYVSIYSPKMISAFRFQGIGKTILYVFILSLLSTLPSAIYFSGSLSEGLKSFNETLKEDLPSFTIENGLLSSDSDKPVEIKKDGFFIILDDTGSYGVEEMEAKENAIGILSDKFVFSTNGQAQTYEYSLLNMTLSKEDIMEISSQFNQLLPIVLTIMVVVMYLFSSFVKFIEITVLALFGLAFKNSLQRKVNFKQLWVIAAYSTTLATIFFIIMDSLQVIVPSGFFLNWFVHLIVLYLVLKEIPPLKKKIATP
ncbi:DUF1189 domain-containing protein [Bacillus sp. UMB0899]|uniref:DUF1189 domain-containing protein n=1 Tax=Metabacillus schmidteae TaxID=2730405 RepID=UPI000C80FAE2|nr:DUF1189 domain-containing protein [Metabacillus schmidteae]PMC39640.1 DUF1189 domain-containing protein [Bacillus sp. UMB0899]